MQETSTLKQLSQILNLSISTVSRALKDHPDISEKTKQKVRELAQALEYEPNKQAINLRKHTSDVLGILVPSLDNFFYDSFTAAVEVEARAKGYSVLIMQSGESAEIEAANLKLLKNNNVAGIFVSITDQTKDISSFLKLQSKNVPVLFFDRVPEYEACNKICLADKHAATLAAETLIKKNKKNILALFGQESLTISQKRFLAFTETFKNQMPDANIKSYFLNDKEEAKATTQNALHSETRPDAVFCMGDLTLIGTMQAIQDFGLQVPKDIGVISISNGLIPTLYNPKITYVETSGYKLGKLAFNRMMECLAGSSFLQELTVESVLVMGDSI